MRVVQRERLLSILEIQAQTGKTSRMRAHMRKALEEAGMMVQKRDRQLFAWKGNLDESVPIYVAHSDTVHAIVPPEKYALGMYTDKGDIVYHAFDPQTRKWRGVGGDDKCGLWVALEAAHALPNVGVIVTIDEESGCQGARLLTSEDSSHASVLIQADRRGNDDAVRKTFDGALSGDDWQDHVGKQVLAHGYDWCNFGAPTDVAAMKRDVSAVNLSAGYYSPHGPNEYISENDLENCLELAITLGEKSAGNRWTHAVEDRRPKYTQPTYAYAQMRSGERVWDQDRGLFIYPDTGEYAIQHQGRYRYIPIVVVEAMGNVYQEIKDMVDIEHAVKETARIRKCYRENEFAERYEKYDYAKRCDVLTCYKNGTLLVDEAVVFCDIHLRLYQERFALVQAAWEVAAMLGHTVPASATQEALALGCGF